MRARFASLAPALAAVLLAGCVAFAVLSAKQAERASARQAQSIAAAAAAAKEAREVALGEHVVELPEDGAGWFTSVFTSEQITPRERQLLDWFDRNPQLAALKSQTHYHAYTPRSGVYERFASITSTGLPAVVVQDAEGRVIYKASGQNVPQAPWPLVKGIVECIRAHCPHWPRPKPKPEPAPEPDPIPDVRPGPPNVIPDVVGPNENTPDDARDDTLLVVGAVFLLALIGGFVAAARRANDRYL